MPHFGLMDEANMPEDEAALMRAKLHIRSGRRRLAQKKLAAGVAVLYDSISYAMKWYFLTHEQDSTIRIPEGDNLASDRERYRILQAAGIVKDSLDFEQLVNLLEPALDSKPLVFDSEAFMAQIDAFMTQVGVMPFDEAALPAEDPDTY